MIHLKALIWFLLALFSIKLIVVANIGKKVKSYMGYNKLLSIALVETNQIVVVKQKKIEEEAREELDEDYLSTVNLVRGP